MKLKKIIKKIYKIRIIQVLRTLYEFSTDFFKNFCSIVIPDTEKVFVGLIFQKSNIFIQENMVKTAFSSIFC